MNVRGGRWSQGAPGGHGACLRQAGARRPVRMRAMRWSWPDTMPLKDVPIDKASLKHRMQALRSEMAAINKQLNELEASAKEELAEEEATENDPV